MDNPVTPIEQKIVVFYEDSLMAIRAADGHIYVAIGQMCDALGLDRASQTRRIRNNEILADGYQGSVKLTYPDGGTQASGVLRVDLAPLWLTGIRVKAVKEEIRPKLRRFQREAAKVLWEAFQEGRLTGALDLEELLKQDTDAVQAYKTLQAMVQLARNQILIEARLDSQDGRLGDHEERLEQIETMLGNSQRYVAPEQASQISQGVKAVALVLTKRSGSNQYGSVYGELYRKFGITSYKLLPAKQFEEAMKFLTDWHQDLVGEAPF